MSTWIVAGAAHALEGVVLKHAEELGLERRRHLADLVQEDGAAVGQLELALSPLVRPGEGALLVPEQLARHQLFREGRAVDDDERAPPSRAPGVHGAGEHFLAGTALAEQQHRRGAGRRAPRPLDGLADGGALADDGLRLVDLLLGKALRALEGLSLSWPSILEKTCTVTMATPEIGSAMRLPRPAPGDGYAAAGPARGGARLDQPRSEDRERRSGDNGRSSALPSLVHEHSSMRRVTSSRCWPRLSCAQVYGKWAAKEASR